MEMFNKDKTRLSGFRGYCKQCAAKCYQFYCERDPVVIMVKRMVRNARARAKEKGLVFDIDADFVLSMVGKSAQFASHCPLLGIPLSWSVYRGNVAKALPNSPSLDRIDSTKGYTKDNVWVISYRANAIKHNASHEELTLITRNLGRAIVNNLDF